MSSVLAFKGADRPKPTNDGDNFPALSLNYKNTAFLLDVDDCLVPSTVREMAMCQKKILWDLYNLTNGAIALVTNSDMRGIDEMLSGFPCVSEHGTLFRLERGGRPDDLAPHLPTEQIIADIELQAASIAVKTTYRAEDLHGDMPILKLEAKQNSVALVFGKHESLRDVAHAMLQSGSIQDMYSNNQFKIHGGKDAIELVPIGFEKYLALDKIMAHPNFAGRKPVVFGDSGPDALLMKAAFENYDGQGRSVGDAFPVGYEDYPIAKLRDVAHAWSNLKSMRDLFKSQKEITQDFKTTLVPRLDF